MFEIGIPGQNSGLIYRLKLQFSTVNKISEVQNVTATINTTRTINTAFFKCHAA